MILRKPYVLFIKFFKPMHILLSFLIVYLIYNTNKILSFLSNYIYSDVNVVGEKIYSNYINVAYFFIPIILIICCLIFFGVMYRKEKPVLFYFVSIISFIVILVVNIYCSKTLSLMEENIVPIKVIKLNHDLSFIGMILETFLFILFFVRGLGIDYKKLDFNSDVSNLDINDSDKEEFEVNININFDENLRKKNKLIRYVKYLYKENKFIINSCAVAVLMLIFLVTFITLIFGEKEKKEGVVYNLGEFNIKIDKSMILKNSHNGKEITKNYLIVVQTELQSNKKNLTLNSNDFFLKIGKTTYRPQYKYNNALLDLGEVYNRENLTSEYKRYLMVFEIPEKYKKSEMKFVYNNRGYLDKIKLNPKKLSTKKNSITKNLGEKLNFENSLGDISFSVNNFEIKDKYMMEYSFCIKENDCIPSKEYIKPTINQDFDKTIFKVNVNYKNKSNLNLQSFYELLTKFGSIHYKIDGKWYTQGSMFEELKSKKVKVKNIEYIGINSSISNADSIKLVFNIRNFEYVYILK